MNVRNITPKEQMLKKIRQALLQKREHPHPDFEDSQLYTDESDSLDVTFARELVRVGGEFVYCDGEISVIENLIILVEKLNISKIQVWEPGIHNLLDHYGFPYLGDENQLMQSEAAITGCECLIARHGSVLVSNANTSGRRLSAFPAIHIVFAKASQVVMDAKLGLHMLKQHYQTSFPSMITMLTGPSRPIDASKDVVASIHMPKKLIVFFIEDRF